MLLNRNECYIIKYRLVIWGVVKVIFRGKS